MEQTIEYKGYRVEIVSDNDPLNPRTEWDNLGTMVCWHRRYNLGDKHDFSTPDDAWQEIKREGHIVLPLFLYDHSGITMNTTGFSCGWDSGRVGYIYISLEKVRKEYSWKKITKKRRERILEYLKGEVETYDQFLTGEVYGFKVLDAEDEELDSCWGFYGDLGIKDAIQEGKGHIDWYVKKKVKEHLLQVKQWILNKVPFIYRKPLQLI